jgi:hypothetical protein
MSTTKKLPRVIWDSSNADGKEVRYRYILTAEVAMRFSDAEEVCPTVFVERMVGLDKMGVEVWLEQRVEEGLERVIHREFVARLLAEEATRDAEAGVDVSSASGERFSEKYLAAEAEAVDALRAYHRSVITVGDADATLRDACYTKTTELWSIAFNERFAQASRASS